MTAIAVVYAVADLTCMRGAPCDCVSSADVDSSVISPVSGSISASTISGLPCVLIVLFSLAAADVVDVAVDSLDDHFSRLDTRGDELVAVCCRCAHKLGVVLGVEPLEPVDDKDPRLAVCPSRHLDGESELLRPA